MMLECLADPKHRGPAKDTSFKVATELNDAGAKHTITGENVTPEGRKCMEGVLQASNVFVAQPKGTPPVTGELPLLHSAGAQPAVTFGTNAASDAVGNLRLAQNSWCSCYGDYKTAQAPLVKATVKFMRGSDKPSEVTLDPATDPRAQRLGACLKEKIASTSAVSLKDSDALTVPYAFQHVNSNALDADPAAPPPVQFLQLEVIRGRRAADTILAVAERGSAVKVYDALVQKFKAKSGSVSFKELDNKCKALLRADEGWAAAVEKQLDTDKKTLTLVSSLKAQDASWGEAETAANNTVATGEKDLAAAKKTRADDEKVCPKERY
jgi:hypothetical protein